jgi:hypothetical protein
MELKPGMPADAEIKTSTSNQQDGQDRQDKNRPAPHMEK